jgi:hypothetical protein
LGEEFQRSDPAKRTSDHSHAIRPPDVGKNARRELDMLAEHLPLHVQRRSADTAWQSWSNDLVIDRQVGHEPSKLNPGGEPAV